MSTSATHRGIVVGVDGSPSAKVAVDWAASDAALRNVPLTLVHVLTPPTVVTSVPRTASTWPAGPAAVRFQTVATNPGPQDSSRRVRDRRRPRTGGQAVVGEH